MNGKSILAVAAHSTYTVLADAIKGAPGGRIKDMGDVALLGGDFVIDEGRFQSSFFARGQSLICTSPLLSHDADGKCIFCHRMRTTADHADVAKLSALLKGSKEEA